MKIFITSDHHFNHKNIIRYCNRPFRSVKQMNEYMIRQWNKKVGKRDTVYFLGDLAFARRGISDLYYLRGRLNGTIFIIPGNHDKINMLKQSGFIILVPEYDTFKIKNLILSHRPLERIPPGYINVHGHIHEKETYGKRINACVDVTGFSPNRLTYYTRKANQMLME